MLEVDEPFLDNSTSELLESVESEDSTLTILLLLRLSSPLLVVDLSSDLAFLLAAAGAETVADFSILLAVSTFSGSLKA